MAPFGVFTCSVSYARFTSCTYFAILTGSRLRLDLARFSVEFSHGRLMFMIFIVFYRLCCIYLSIFIYLFIIIYYYLFICYLLAVGYYYFILRFMGWSYRGLFCSTLFHFILLCFALFSYFFSHFRFDCVSNE